MSGKLTGGTETVYTELNKVCGFLILNLKRIYHETNSDTYNLPSNQQNELYTDNKMICRVLIEGRTLVPLRAVSECFGAQVEWDGDTQLISITWK